MSSYALSNRTNGTTVTRRVVRQYFNEVSGTIESIGEKQERNCYVFREFVLVDEEVIPQPIPFQLRMKRVSLLNGFKIGDKIKVTYRVKCNRGTAQWEGRIFVNLEALNIEAVEEASANAEEFGMNADNDRMENNVEVDF